MSAPDQNDPRLEQAGASDESLLAAHEKLLGSAPDDHGRYKLLPLSLLFFFSGLIFYAGTYLNRYAGHYDPAIHNENASPTKAGAVIVAIDPVVLGKKQYEAICVACHQPTGLGLPGIYPPLAGSEWANGSPERLIRIVIYGFKGPVKVKGVDYNGAAMPAIGKVTGGGYNLTDEKLAAVLTYVRQEWGNKSGPITAEQVATIHAKEGDRKEVISDELLKLP